MRLAVFGGTGTVGSLVVEQALSAGHDVRAFVRDRSRAHPGHPNLRLIEGTLDDGASVAATLHNTDAAICALSAGNRVLTGFGEVAVPVMVSRGPRRIVALAGASFPMAGDPTSFKLGLMTFLMRLVPGRMIDDVGGLVRQLSNSELDWTLVRSAGFSSRPGSGQIFSSPGHAMSLGATIPRADVAAFLLAAAMEPGHHADSPMIEAA